MKNKLINELAYVVIIVAALFCFACIELDMVPEIVQTFDPLPPGEGLSIGETAPAFSLPDADGNLVALSKYAGQKVVIQFYSTGT